MHYHFPMAIKAELIADNSIFVDAAVIASGVSIGFKFHPTFAFTRIRSVTTVSVVDIEA
jgi:hypothetical protein